MELYSPTENEIFSFPGKWMELVNIILSEISQVQKAKKPHVLPYMKIIDLNIAAFSTILWDIGLTKGRSRTGGIRQGIETKYLNVIDVLTVQE
jgi:hypothetical protein